MHDEQDAIESVTGDLGEAGELLETARKALERLQDASGGDTATIRHAASRIERMADEVARIERELARQAVAG